MVQQFMLMVDLFSQVAGCEIFDHSLPLPTHTLREIDEL